MKKFIMLSILCVMLGINALIVKSHLIEPDYVITGDGEILVKSELLTGTDIACESFVAMMDNIEATTGKRYKVINEGWVPIY
jgi:hypothetical protein